MRRYNREVLNCGGVNDKRLTLKDSLVQGLLFSEARVVGEKYLGRIGLAVSVNDENFFSAPGKAGSEGETGCCFSSAAFLRGD